MAGTFRRRLVAAERETTVFRSLLARHRACGRWQQVSCARIGGNAGAKPLGNILQFPDNGPQTEHDDPGASRDRAYENQGIAETEFLDRDSETDREETGQQLSLIHI